MSDSDLQSRLNAVVEEMIGRDPSGRAIPRHGMPFDTSKPYIHDTKSEFIEERDAVVLMASHAEAMQRFIRDAYQRGGAEAEPMNLRVATFVDVEARLATRDDIPDVIPTFILKGACEHSLSTSLLFHLFEYRRALLERSRELKDQEQEFWSGAHRPPNHYARTIALRLARLHARERIAIPTVGVSGEGGHPSTDFSRAAEQVFEILNIRANVRTAATWAVAQLTVDDLGNGTNFFKTLLGGTLSVPPNPHATVSRAMEQKGLKKNSASASP